MSGFLGKNFVIWSGNGGRASVCPDTFLTVGQATKPCPVVRSQQGNAIMPRDASPAHFTSYPKVTPDLLFTVGGASEKSRFPSLMVPITF